jgi:hypothetical protein
MNVSPAPRNPAPSRGEQQRSAFLNLSPVSTSGSRQTCGHFSSRIIRRSRSCSRCGRPLTLQSRSWPGCGMSIRSRGGLRRDPFVLRNRAPHRKRQSMAKRGASVALGAKYAPLTAVWLLGSIVHHACPLGVGGLRRCSGPVACFAPCICGAGSGCVGGVCARAARKTQLVAAAS